MDIPFLVEPRAGAKELRALRPGKIQALVS
jgi:hypothetical protein